MIDEAREHFVIIAGRKDKSPSNIYLIASASSKAAHDRAAELHRKEVDLASNIFVLTKTVFRSDDEASASAFLTRLLEKMDENR